MVGNWSRTTIVRFDGDDQNPIMISPDGYAYEHEIGKNDAGSPMMWRLRSAPIRLGEGEQRITVYGMRPDFQRQSGRIQLKLTGREWPNDPDDKFRVFVKEIPRGEGKVEFSMDGRMIEIEMHQALLDGDFRLGKPQFVVRPAGRGR